MRARYKLHRKAIESGFIFLLDLYRARSAQPRAVIICAARYSARPVAPRAFRREALHFQRVGRIRAAAAAVRVSRGFRDMRRDASVARSIEVASLPPFLLTGYDTTSRYVQGVLDRERYSRDGSFLGGSLPWSRYGSRVKYTLHKSLTANVL